MTHWRGPEKWEEVVVWRRTLIVSKGWPTWVVGGGLVGGYHGWGGGREGGTGELGDAGEYTGYEAFVVLVVCAAGGGGLLDRRDGDGYGGRYRTRSLLLVFLHLGGLTSTEGRAGVGI